MNAVRLARAVEPVTLWAILPNKNIAPIPLSMEMEPVDQPASAKLCSQS